MTRSTIETENRTATLALLALSCAPLAIGVGMAIDYWRAATLKANLQAAAETAVLAAAAAGSGEEARTAEISVREAPDCADARTIFVQPRPGLYRIVVEAHVPTWFMRLANYPTLKVNAVAETRAITPP